MDELKLERAMDTKAGKGTLTVSGGVTIGEAGDLREALLATLEGATEVEVDVSGVTGIDLTGLQLLCAAHQTAGRNGKSLHLTDGGNGTFRDVALAAGFKRHKGCAFDQACSCIWVGGVS